MDHDSDCDLKIIFNDKKILYEIFNDELLYVCKENMQQHVQG